MVLKKISKKGMFFTIATIFILSFFLLSLGIYSLVNEQKNSVDKRIETLNNFVFSVEKDLPRQIYASGFRMIFVMEQEIIETGEYISDLNSTFEELFYNGSIEGESKEIMNGVKFSDIASNLNSRAQKINANVSFSNPKISILQEDPWNIMVNLNVELLVEDKGNVASWNKSSQITAYIPISGFEDPIYIKETNGLVTNKFNRSIFENFTSGTNVSNLTEHLKGSYYIASSLAPNFLYRLEGIFQPSENGVESLVYLPKLADSGIIVKDKSCVDYIYFSNQSPSSSKIQGMPTWLKIDLAHLETYQAENLTI